MFAVADYPEQMADKQLLATWKRVRQSHTKQQEFRTAWDKSTAAYVVSGYINDEMYRRCPMKTAYIQKSFFFRSMKKTFSQQLTHTHIKHHK